MFQKKFGNPDEFGNGVSLQHAADHRGNQFFVDLAVSCLFQALIRPRLFTEDTRHRDTIPAHRFLLHDIPIEM